MEERRKETRDYSWLWARKAIAIAKCLLDTSVRRFHLMESLLGSGLLPAGLVKLFWRQKGCAEMWFWSERSPFFLDCEWLYLPPSLLRLPKCALKNNCTLSLHRPLVHHIFILTSIGQSMIILFCDKRRDFDPRVRPKEKTYLKICLEYSGGVGRKAREWEWSLVLSEDIHWCPNQTSPLDTRFRIQNK